MNHNNHGWLSSGSDNEDCILQHIPSSSSTPSMTRGRNNTNNNSSATTALRRGASNKRATTTTTTVYLHQSSSDNDNNVEDANDSDYQFSQDSSSSSFYDDDDDDNNDDDDSTTSQKKKKQQKQLMSNKQKSLNSGGVTTSRKRRETKSLSTTRRKRRKTQNSSSDSRNDSSSSGSDHEVITRRTTRSTSNSSSGSSGNGGSSSSRKRTRGNHKFHGFENIGNTCYMGAVLTALFHLEPFLSPSFTQTSNQLNHRKNNSHHGKNVVDCIARLYQLFKKSEESINPSDLKQLLSEKTNMFEGHDQEDAHEFLVTLLSCIQDECHQQEQQQENEKDEGDENEESSSNDPIQQNFETYITLYDKCSACHSTNKNTECFPVMTVHFPMEKEEEEATKRSNGLNSAKRATRSSSRSIGKAPTHSIQDLFNHWFTEERIDDVKCNKCKKKTQMIRTKRMDSLPRIFCIHVNRFTHQNVNASRVVKNPRRVIISKQLNIGDGLCERDVAPPAQPTLLPPVAHHVTPSSTSDHQHKKSPDSNAILIDSGDSDNDHHSLKTSATNTKSKNKESDSSFHYELMSIIHHKGRTKEQGHYFTHVNSFGYNQSITDKEQQQMSQDSTAKPTWFEYDDHSVQSLTEKDVLEDASKQATCYVLFYQFKNSSLH